MEFRGIGDKPRLQQAPPTTTDFNTFLIDVFCFNVLIQTPLFKRLWLNVLCLTVLVQTLLLHAPLVLNAVVTHALFLFNFFDNILSLAH